MSFITALIASFRSDEEGQGLAEYALILALIAIVAIVALLFLGGQISTILSPSARPSRKAPVKSRIAGVVQAGDPRFTVLA